MRKLYPIHELFARIARETENLKQLNKLKQEIATFGYEIKPIEIKRPRGRPPKKIFPISSLFFIGKQKQAGRPKGNNSWLVEWVDDVKTLKSSPAGMTDKAAIEWIVKFSANNNKKSEVRALRYVKGLQVKLSRERKKLQKLKEK